jgi:hypothetical protein
MISDNLGHSLTVMDNGPNDSNPLMGAIGVDTALLAAFPELNAMSNVTATITASSVTILSTSGNLFGNAPARITITSSANNLMLPSASNRHETSTDTFLYAGGAAGASGTTTDGVHTGNVLFGQNVTDPPFTYVSTGFASNSGSSGGGHAFDFNNGGALYAITSITGIDVQPGNALSQYQANVTVTAGTAAAVPEPASLALLGVGAAGLLGYGWKKRRAA